MDLVLCQMSWHFLNVLTFSLMMFFLSRLKPLPCRTCKYTATSLE